MQDAAVGWRHLEEVDRRLGAETVGEIPHAHGGVVGGGCEVVGEKGREDGSVHRPGVTSESV